MPTSPLPYMLANAIKFFSLLKSLVKVLAFKVQFSQSFRIKLYSAEVWLIYCKLAVKSKQLHVGLNRNSQFQSCTVSYSVSSVSSLSQTPCRNHQRQQLTSSPHDFNTYLMLECYIWENRVCPHVESAYSAYSKDFNLSYLTLVLRWVARQW